MDVDGGSEAEEKSRARQTGGGGRMVWFGLVWYGMVCVVGRKEGLEREAQVMVEQAEGRLGRLDVGLGPWALGP